MRAYVYEPREKRRASLASELENAGLQPLFVGEEFFETGLAPLTQTGSEHRAILIGESVNTHRQIRAVRHAGCENPLIILRDFRNSADTAAALDRGADDVIVSPIKGGEVLSRINSIVRRFHGHAAESISVGEVTAFDGRRVDARTLLLDELIPAARDGLASVDVPEPQIDRYLGIVEARAKSGQTGSNWLLNTFQAHRDREPSAVWCDAVSAMLQEQKTGRAVHEWDLAQKAEDLPVKDPTVATIMTTDLFTVRPDDVVDLAISVMEWKHIRHIPVEGEDGELFGVLTARDLLRVASQAQADDVALDSAAVKSLMRTDFVQVNPETTLRDALSNMLGSDLGCLMVVARGRLMGIVTERDLLRAAADALARQAT